MPVATVEKNGLMSAMDKKYLQRYINDGTHLILIAETILLSMMVMGQLAEWKKKRMIQNLKFTINHF